jgi:hypothetical protein
MIDILCEMAETISKHNVGAGKIILELNGQIYKTRFGNHARSDIMDDLRILCAQYVYKCLRQLITDEFKATIEFEEYDGIYSFSMRKK